MGASPSNIPNHEQVQAVDILGDSFPSGASFYLTNRRSDYKECLAAEPSGQTKLKSVRNSPDRKWIISYAWDDRSKVTIRNIGENKYLAIKSAGFGSQTFLHDGEVYWYVYKAEANGFWLSTTQSPNCFLCSWDRGDVGNITNLEGAGQGKGFQLFEENKQSMTWQLEWTPEYERSKEATPDGRKAISKHQTGRPESAAGSKQRQNADAQAALQRMQEREEHCRLRENDLDRKTAALNAQLREEAAKQAQQDQTADHMTEFEQALVAKEKALREREADLAKEHSDLEALYDQVLAAEVNLAVKQNDPAAAQKIRAEQLAQKAANDRKTEATRKQRQQELEEAAQVKADNVAFQARLARLEDAQRKQQRPLDVEKATLEAELQHARDMVTMLQRQGATQYANGPLPRTSVPPTTSAPISGFHILPPIPRMPDGMATKRPENKNPATLRKTSMIEPPVTKMPGFALTYKKEKLNEHCRMPHQVGMTRVDARTHQVGLVRLNGEHSFGLPAPSSGLSAAEPLARLPETNGHLEIEQA
ncbi:hypothetical protein Tdes44962_MAKER04441 [Teratosphaeria destructans]|uniref:Uncharacterized protein n=1 Tax=Teratosphaeria destructans TaxID=418781 RepID=A0A9W7VZY0_9PEZI|nr:hypothetical protein Tdes44962_MAKER04441 [Teratosphaeria destructans]